MHYVMLNAEFRLYGPGQQCLARLLELNQNSIRMMLGLAFTRTSGRSGLQLYFKGLGLRLPAQTAAESANFIELFHPSRQQAYDVPNKPSCLSSAAQFRNTRILRACRWCQKSGSLEDPPR